MAFLPQGEWLFKSTIYWDVNVNVLQWHAFKIIDKWFLKHNTLLFWCSRSGLLLAWIDIIVGGCFKHGKDGQNGQMI